MEIIITRLSSYVKKKVLNPDFTWAVVIITEILTLAKWTTLPVVDEAGSLDLKDLLMDCLETWLVKKSPLFWLLDLNQWRKKAFRVWPDLVEFVLNLVVPTCPKPQPEPRADGWWRSCWRWAPLGSVWLLHYRWSSTWFASWGRSPKRTTRNTKLEPVFMQLCCWTQVTFEMALQ